MGIEESGGLGNPKEEPEADADSHYLYYNTLWYSVKVYFISTSTYVSTYVFLRMPGGGFKLMEGNGMGRKSPSTVASLRDCPIRERHEPHGNFASYWHECISA